MGFDPCADGEYGITRSPPQHLVERCVFSGLLRVPVDLFCLIIHNGSQAAEQHFTQPENV